MRDTTRVCSLNSEFSTQYSKTSGWRGTRTLNARRHGVLNAACQPVAPPNQSSPCGIRTQPLQLEKLTTSPRSPTSRIVCLPQESKSSRVDSNHRSTACKAAAFAARPRDDFFANSNSNSGLRPCKYPTEESNLVQLFRRQSCIQHTRRANVLSVSNQGARFELAQLASKAGHLASGSLSKSSDDC